MGKNPNQPSYTRQLKDITRNLQYYVRINDDQSKPFSITVVPAPRVVETLVQLKFPTYMNRDADQSDQLNLEVPEGTGIKEWVNRIRSDIPAVTHSFMPGRRRCSP